MMPGMSGLEVCQELRKDPATARIPVILLTALARETDITAGLIVISARTWLLGLWGAKLRPRSLACGFLN